MFISCCTLLSPLLLPYIIILVFGKNEIMHLIFHINDSITFCTAFCQYLPRSKLFVTMDIFALRFKYSYRMNTVSIFSPLILDMFMIHYSVKVDVKSQLYQDNGYTYKPALQCVEWLQNYFRPSTDQLKLPSLCHSIFKEGI